MGNSLSGYSDNTSSDNSVHSDLEMEMMEKDHGNRKKEGLEKGGVEEPEAEEATTEEERKKEERKQGDRDDKAIEAAADKTESLAKDQEAGMAEIGGGLVRGVAGKTNEEKEAPKKATEERRGEMAKERHGEMVKEKKGPEMGKEKTDEDKKDERHRKRRSDDEDTDGQPTPKKAKTSKFRKVINFISCTKEKAEGERKRRSGSSTDGEPAVKAAAIEKMPERTVKGRIAKKLKAMKDGFLGLFGKKEKATSSDSAMSVSSVATDASRDTGTAVATPAGPVKSRSSKKTPEKPLPKLPKSTEATGKVMKPPSRDRVIKGQIVEGKEQKEAQREARIQVLPDYDESDEADEDESSRSLSTAKLMKKKKKKTRVIEIHKTEDTESFHENYNDLRRDVWYSPSLEGLMDRTQRVKKEIKLEATEEATEATQRSTRSPSVPRSVKSEAATQASASTPEVRSAQREPAGHINHPADVFGAVWDWLNANDDPVVDPIPIGDLPINGLDDPVADPIPFADPIAIDGLDDPLDRVNSDDENTASTQSSSNESLLSLDRTPSDGSDVPDPLLLDVEATEEEIREALEKVLEKPRYTLDSSVLDVVNGLNRSRTSLRSIRRALESGNDVGDRLIKVTRKVTALRRNLGLN